MLSEKKKGAVTQRSGGTHFDYVEDWDRLREEKGWWHSFELPNGKSIDGVCDLPGLKKRVRQFPIPEDLTGKRVLDIGAWDGWFTFEMERRGAEVVALDCWDNPRFRQMHRWLNSGAEYCIMDIYDISPERLGKFDIVLFLGVLYHLKHPLLALERVCSVTTDFAAVDSFVLPPEIDSLPALRGRAIMEFYDTTQMGGQTDNWVGPNIECLMAMSRAAGFARVNFLARLPHSACLACFRKWDDQVIESAPRPILRSAFHHTNFGINFSSLRDDYVTCGFAVTSDEVAINEIKPSVGPYGVLPINLTLEADEWQVSFKLPLGLTSGWHNVTLALGHSASSNPVRIAVDFVNNCSSLEITGVADGSTWSPNQIDLNQGTVLSLWVAGLPENADRSNVDILIDDRCVELLHLAPEERGNPRQMNVRIPSDTHAGEVILYVRFGAVLSPSVNVAVARCA